VSDHPNVVTIYDVGEHDHVPFIVMELYGGGSVADRLREGAIARSQALDWLAQSAAALDYAHGEGIVHRDVKPANLLLDERERLAVGDFGIARLADESALTQAGTVLGTAAYLSPEQALGHEATAASDRYALAVVAYELLAGRRPFGGEHLAAQARAHVEVPPPAAGLGAELDEVLQRGLAKEPEDRYLTAGRFVDELRAAAGRLAVPPAPAAPATGPTRLAASDPPTRVSEPVPVAAAPLRRDPPTRVSEPIAPVAPAYTPQRAGGGRGKALLAGLAVLALLAGLAAVLLNGGGGDGAGERVADDPPAATQPEATEPDVPPATEAEPDPAPAPEPEPEPAPEPEPEPEPAPAPEADGDAGGQGDGEGEGGAGPDTSGETPEALNDQGFAALNAGNVDRAITLLEASDRGFRSQGGAADATTWGFALFNLGQAYERAGRPAEAVSAYERRLEVSPENQRGVVERALERAREAAGQGGGGE
jgi:serine/threonine-protein kinase